MDIYLDTVSSIVVLLLQVLVVFYLFLLTWLQNCVVDFPRIFMICFFVLLPPAKHIKDSSYGFIVKVLSLL
jgi:hypothetical protein